MKQKITKRKSDLTKIKTPEKLPAPLARQMPDPQPTRSDSLFIGLSHGRLLQWSIRQRKVIKHFGKITNSEIGTSRTTPDKKHLFVGDQAGR
jgi:hypothetical protein